ncbi:tetratricopeptide repeat protein [Kribbella sp. CA-294648]|uniref:tetratricopeptide repeat protein n=1 Tax=Kribbella sp. CA-294648 TaxID=3239948 RepID=UPI003D8DDA73
MSDLLVSGVRQRNYGDFRAAVATFEEALSLSGPHVRALDNARLLNELGVAQRYRGDMPEARHLYRRALDLVHPVAGWTLEAKDLFATICHNLASLEHMCGNLGPGELWARLAVHIRTKVHGREHLSVLADKAVLATVIQGLGRLEQADEVLRHILFEYRRRLGANHYEVAVALHNLAACASAKGDNHAARSLALESLQMKRAALGGEHPDIAVSLANLGYIEERLGNVASARTAYRDAVQILGQRVRGDHPTLVACLKRFHHLSAC